MTVSLSIWRRWNECENVFTPKECKMSFPCCLLSGAGLPFKYVSFFHRVEVNNLETIDQ